MSGTVTVGSVLSFLGEALDVSANLLVIIDFFTSTMEPEVSKIYGFTYDTRENLKKVMEKMGVPYEYFPADDIANNWEKMTESFKRTNDSLNEAKMLNREMAIAVSEETNEMIGKSLESTGDALRESCEGIEENTMRDMDRNVMMIDKSWEEVKEAIKVSGGMYTHNTKGAMDRRLMMMEAIPGLIEKFDTKAKELYEKAIEIYKKYPQTFKIPMVEESTTLKDGGQAKADMEKLSGELTKETDTAQPPTITEADAELIADKIVAKLNGEKALESTEKTTDVVSNEKVANMVTFPIYGVDDLSTITAKEVDTMTTEPIGAVDVLATHVKEDVDRLVTFMDNFDEVSDNLLAAVEVLQKNIDTTAEEKTLVTTPPVEVVNAVVEEVRAGFENILNAFAASQTSADPTAGDEKILTVSLTDENSKNISTMIVTQLNEEKAIETIEKTAEGVTNEELGIEVRDSQRSLKNEIGDIKAILEVLLKLIEKKAMTFDDIYKMVFRRLAHEHEMQTGRRVGR